MLEDVARVEDAPVAVAAIVLDVTPAAAAVARLLEHALEVVAATVLHIALPPPVTVVTMLHVASAATSSGAPAGLLAAQPDVERKSKSDQM